MWPSLHQQQRFLAVCLDIRTARFDGMVAHTIVLLPTMLIIGYM
jgi:hypothetical protein